MMKQNKKKEIWQWCIMSVPNQTLQELFGKVLNIRNRKINFSWKLFYIMWSTIITITKFFMFIRVYVFNNNF